MTLREAPLGKRVRVVGFDSGRGLAARLAALGVHVGEELTILSEGPIGGPLLVELAASGSRVMLGRGMVGKIRVEPVAPPATPDRP